MRGDQIVGGAMGMKSEGEGTEEANAGKLMRTLKALGAHGRWFFQAKRMKGVDNRLAHELSRWEEEKIKSERPRVTWHHQKLL